jgi:hypothetical protein
LTLPTWERDLTARRSASSVGMDCARLSSCSTAQIAFSAVALRGRCILASRWSRMVRPTARVSLGGSERDGIWRPQGCENSCGALRRFRLGAWGGHRGGDRARRGMGRHHRRGLGARVGQPFRFGNPYRRPGRTQEVSGVGAAWHPSDRIAIVGEWFRCREVNLHPYRHNRRGPGRNAHHNPDIGHRARPHRRPREQAPTGRCQAVSHWGRPGILGRYQFNESDDAGDRVGFDCTSTNPTHVNCANGDRRDVDPDGRRTPGGRG